MPVSNVWLLVLAKDSPKLGSSKGVAEDFVTVLLVSNVWLLVSVAKDSW